MGEDVEVVHQVLTKHAIFCGKRWIFLKPHLLFEPIPFAFVGHGNRECSGSNTARFSTNHSSLLLISSYSILVELCG